MSAVVKKACFGLASAGVASLPYFLLPPDCPEPARRSAAIFVLAALFWALEIIPLFATSIAAVLLLIFALGGEQPYLQSFANPVILLFLGGFALARVLNKYGADRVIVSRFMRLFGSRPYGLLLGILLTTGFVSLWMSNTAATALMLAVLGPLFVRFEAGDRFKKALILAVPFAANIGGIGTPVSTPPNAIAVGILAEHGVRIDFLSWMIMAVPPAAVLPCAASGILYWMFPPSAAKLQVSVEVPPPLTGRARGSLAVCLFTVLLWLTSGWHGIPESVVSLLAVALFAAFGFLDRDDLNRLNWDILVLMWGGLALGTAMESSGLGRWIVGQPLFEQQGFGLVATFGILAAVISMFMSNTPTAGLMVPLALSVQGGDSVSMAVVVALACSFDMILPVSTPSNALAFATGGITTRDMMKSGFLIVIVSLLLLLLGYPFFISGRLVRP